MIEGWREVGEKEGDYLSEVCLSWRSHWYLILLHSVEFLCSFRVMNESEKLRIKSPDIHLAAL